MTLSEESPTRKMAAAIMGAIVVIILVLLLILGVQALRSFISRTFPTVTKTTNNTSYNPSAGLSVLNPTSTTSGQTNNYQSMPNTGPREDMLLLLAFLSLIGYGIVVVSQKVS